MIIKLRKIQEKDEVLYLVYQKEILLIKQLKILNQLIQKLFKIISHLSIKNYIKKFIQQLMTMLKLVNKKKY